MKKEMPVVHLWQPLMWHCDQHIVGNKEGLRRLVDIINGAINTNGKSSTCLYINDGEGHDLTVECVEDTALLAVPYTDEIAKERSEKAIYPWSDEK